VSVLQEGKADLLQFVHVASKQACEMVITTIKAPSPSLLHHRCKR